MSLKASHWRVPASDRAGSKLDPSEETRGVIMSPIMKRLLEGPPIAGGSTTAHLAELRSSINQSTGKKWSNGFCWWRLWRRPPGWPRRPGAAAEAKVAGEADTAWAPGCPSWFTETLPAQTTTTTRTWAYHVAFALFALTPFSLFFDPDATNLAMRIITNFDSQRI